MGGKGGAIALKECVCVPVAWAHVSLTPERGGAVSAYSGRTVHSRGSLACGVSASSAPPRPCSLHAGAGSAPAPTGSPAARQRSDRSTHTVEQTEKTHTQGENMFRLNVNWQRDTCWKEKCVMWICPKNETEIYNVWNMRYGDGHVTCYAGSLSVRGHISAPHVP